LRFVFDTNVIVSALLLEDSTSRRAFNLAVERGKILLSFPVLSELNEVLGRRQFRKYVDEDDVRRFISALVREAEWVETRTPVVASRDPKDDKFLELAVSGRATHIISGDSDLLTLNPFQGTPILTPDAFLETIR
jgi:putative PIN family toxin of toxin-antitoxin system